MHNCQNCGAPLEPRDTFCRKCGTNVPQDKTAAAPSSFFLEPTEDRYTSSLNTAPPAALSSIENSAGSPSIGAPSEPDGTSTADDAAAASPFENSSAEISPSDSEAETPQAGAEPTTSAATPFSFNTPADTFPESSAWQNTSGARPEAPPPTPPAASPYPPQAAPAPAPTAPVIIRHQKSVQPPPAFYGGPPAAQPPHYGQFPPGAGSFPARPVPMRPKRTTKTPFIVFIIFVVIVGVLVVFFSSNLKSGSFTPKPTVDTYAFGEEAPAIRGKYSVPQNYAYSVRSDDGVYAVFTNGTEPIRLTKESHGGHIWNTPAGEVTYFYVETNGELDSGLYFTDFNGPAQLIRLAVDDISISSDGLSIFFTEKGSSTCNLYRFTYGDEAPVRIAEDLREYISSPSGSSFLIKNSDNVWEVMTDGRVSSILQPPSDSTPLSISDDGQMYMCNSGFSSASKEYYFCFTQNPGELITLTIGDSFTYAYFNRTGDDILISTSTALYRYSNKVVSCIDTGSQFEDLKPYLGQKLTTINGDGRYTVFDVDSFANFFYVCKDSSYSDEKDTGIYYKMPGGGVKAVFSKADHIYGSQVSPDGYSIYHLAPDPGMDEWDKYLWRFSVDKNGQIQKEIVLDEIISDFSVVPDGTGVFYTSHTDYATLKYKEENAAPVTIAQDIISYQVGGPDGKSCTGVYGASYYAGGAGTAFYYTAETGLSTIAEDAMGVSPPSGGGSFLFTANPEPVEGEEYQYWKDVYLYTDSEQLVIPRTTDYINLVWGNEWYNFLP